MPTCVLVHFTFTVFFKTNFPTAFLPATFPQGNSMVWPAESQKLLLLLLFYDPTLQSFFLLKKYLK